MDPPRSVYSGSRDGATSSAAANASERPPARMNGDLSSSAPAVRNQALESALGLSTSMPQFLDAPRISIIDDIGSLEEMDLLDDLDGLEEVCVDSDPDDDDDASDVSSHYSDGFACIQDLLSKAPEKRSADDLEVVMEFIQHLPAFENMPMTVRERLCGLMRLQSHGERGTVLVRSGDEVDCWWVVFAGAVELQREGHEPARYHLGEAFGVPRSQRRRQIQAGSLVTSHDGTLLLCVAAEQFHDVLARSEQAILEVTEDGAVVLATEHRKVGKADWAQVVVRGTEARLVEHLVAGDDELDYVDDFLLGYRTFMQAPDLAEQLERMFIARPELRGRVARAVLNWVNGHVGDFNGSPEMIGFVRAFRRHLRDANLQGELRLLCVAVARLASFSLDGDDDDDSSSSVSSASASPRPRPRTNGIASNDPHHLSSSVNGSLPQLNADAIAAGGVGSGASSASASSSSQKSSTLLGRRLHGLARRYASTSNMRSSSMRASPASSAPHSLMSSLSSLGPPSPGVAVAGGNGPSPPPPPRPVSSTADPSSLLPATVLKLYRPDHQYRYVAATTATTALDLVRLGLQHFEMGDGEEADYSLCRITVGAEGVVQQTRLPDAFRDLAVQLRPMSRFYLKHNKTTTNLAHNAGLVAEVTQEGACDLLSLDARDVARVVTLKSFMTFRAISSAEYVRSVWDMAGGDGAAGAVGGGDDPESMTDFQRLSSTTNAEMFWVVNEVVGEPMLSMRVRKIKFFLKVAKLCRTLHNFNTMFAITSGLSYGAVTRLRLTWEKLGARDIKSIEEMQILMDPSRNMLTYRSMVNSVSAPIVPFFPVVTKDLTWIYMGNDDRVKGLVNFEKLRMLAKEIRNIRKLHAAPYDVTAMLRDSRDKPADARRLHEQWHSMRRVEHYLAALDVVRNESELDALSHRAEPSQQALAAAVRGSTGSALQ